VRGLSELAGRLDRLAGRQTVGLAVSGGPDSLALMLLAAEWRDRQSPPPRFIVYSVDHALRAAAADEVRFVIAEAERRGFAGRALRWDGPKPAAGRQAAARAARYRLIGAAMAEDGAELLLTAHHRDDQIETVLMRLAHGSGLGGLRGMDDFTEVEAVTVFRPFLDVPRAALAEVVERAGLTPVRDPSNEDAHYERARWRAALPGLAGLGLDAAAIAALARRAGEADAALAQWADAVLAEHVGFDAFGAASLPVAQLTTLPRAVGVKLLAQILAIVGGSRSPRQLGAIERLHDRLAGSEEFLAATIAGTAIRRRGGELRFAREPGRAAVPETVVAAGLSTDWDGRFRIDNRGTLPVVVGMASGLSRRDAEAILGRSLPTPGLAIRAAPLVRRADGAVLALGALSLDAAVEVKFFAASRGKRAT
jgi:tRNA(Ile)-lysidine synthase